jgi:hypothetical protein
VHEKHPGGAGAHATRPGGAVARPGASKRGDFKNFFLAVTESCFRFYLPTLTFFLTI